MSILKRDAHVASTPLIHLRRRPGFGGSWGNQKNILPDPCVDSRDKAYSHPRAARCLVTAARFVALCCLSPTGNKNRHTHLTSAARGSGQYSGMLELRELLAENGDSASIHLHLTGFCFEVFQTEHVQCRVRKHLYHSCWWPTFR